MADQKISQLNSLTNDTVDVLDVLPIVDTSAGETKKVTYQNLMRPKDSIFGIVDNSDITKIVAFQVSGLTTATTRTITVPDSDLTLVGLTTTQTLTNKTLTSPQIDMASNATGDMYYRDATGTTVRLAIGTSGQIISTSSSGIPEWIANPSAADASTTVKGVVEKATTAEITAGTATGGTGAQLFIGADAVGSPGANKIVQFTAAGKYPAADGSLITGLTQAITTLAAGQTTKDASDVSAVQNIAHGLGTTPKKVKITAISGSTINTYSTNMAMTVYNGTTQSSVARHTSSANVVTVNTFTLNNTATATNTQTGVVTFDATNIIITWTKTNSPDGIYYLLWEAEA